MFGSEGLGYRLLGFRASGLGFRVLSFRVLLEEPLIWKQVWGSKAELLTPRGPWHSPNIR